MLKLPVPEAEYENVVLKPSEYQKEMVQSLADRAEAVRDRRVDATVDNMLKITNDGRKLALDQRLINDMLPDEDNSKATTCVDKAFEIWEETKEQKSAQLILKPVASFLMSERIAEHDKERMLADGSRGRVSVKEKLAEMKQKISDQKMPEKPETVKSKGKEESL